MFRKLYFKTALALWQKCQVASTYQPMHERYISKVTTPFSNSIAHLWKRLGCFAISLEIFFEL